MTIKRRQNLHEMKNNKNINKQNLIQPNKSVVVCKLYLNKQPNQQILLLYINYIMKHQSKATDQNEILIKPNLKYTCLEWTIMLFSFITSLAFIFITKNYYILEIILEIDLNQHESFIKGLKIYAYLVIAVVVVVKGCELIKGKEGFVKNIKRQMFNNVINLLLFLIVSFYIWQFAQHSPLTKKQKGQIKSKIYHFILWFILGSSSSIPGHLFGHLCSIRTFKSFGQIIIFSCYIMAFSTLYSLTFSLQKDLFDMIL